MLCFEDFADVSHVPAEYLGGGVGRTADASELSRFHRSRILGVSNALVVPIRRERSCGEGTTEGCLRSHRAGSRDFNAGLSLPCPAKGGDS